MKYTFLIFSVVFFDQLTKILIKNYWINNNLNNGFHYINILGDYVRFVFIENPGIAFGMDPGAPFFLTILTFVIIFFLIYYLNSLIKANNPESLPIAFVLGGAIGNAIDRFLTLVPSLSYNGVIDFIDIGFGDCSYCRWYIFNFADMSISLGLIIIIYQSFFTSKTIEKRNNI